MLEQHGPAAKAAVEAAATRAAADGDVDMQARDDLLHLQIPASCLVDVISIREAEQPVPIQRHSTPLPQEACQEALAALAPPDQPGSKQPPSRTMSTPPSGPASFKGTAAGAQPADPAADPAVTAARKQAADDATAQHIAVLAAEGDARDPEAAAAAATALAALVGTARDGPGAAAAMRAGSVPLLVEWLKARTHALVQQIPSPHSSLAHSHVSVSFHKFDRVYR